ncbi:hypothetical protein FDP41_003532 [Naegleria fowleri]|uniref:Uncharacterized protein n=1 Tax=Naegleria fowleri TaxID=5763 RepID=A0A6A5BUX1_NAEFO|nr:uncharacterized protein FDP41_003532 [Naegleria fowleri]KAF0977540.1 hypothetical protein FDP41_003532 [Naegleria fowleri]CAG4708533.1 unnamed protein product [Naegleria fowleri]
MAQGGVKSASKNPKMQKSKRAPSNGIKKKSKTKQEEIKKQIKKQCTASTAAYIEGEMLAKLKKDGKPLHFLKDSTTNTTTNGKASSNNKKDQKKKTTNK